MECGEYSTPSHEPSPEGFSEPSDVPLKFQRMFACSGDVRILDVVLVAPGVSRGAPQAHTLS